MPPVPTNGLPAVSHVDIARLGPQQYKASRAMTWAAQYNVAWFRAHEAVSNEMKRCYRIDAELGTGATSPVFICVDSAHYVGFLAVGDLDSASYNVRLRVPFEFVPSVTMLAEAFEHVHGASADHEDGIKLMAHELSWGSCDTAHLTKPGMEVLALQRGRAGGEQCSAQAELTHADVENMVGAGTVPDLANYSAENVSTYIQVVSEMSPEHAGVDEDEVAATQLETQVLRRGQAKKPPRAASGGIGSSCPALTETELEDEVALNTLLGKSKGKLEGDSSSEEDAAIDFEAVKQQWIAEALQGITVLVERNTALHTKPLGDNMSLMSVGEFGLPRIRGHEVAPHSVAVVSWPGPSTMFGRCVQLDGPHHNEAVWSVPLLPERGFRECCVVHPDVGTRFAKRSKAIGRAQVPLTAMRLKRMWEASMQLTTLGLCVACKAPPPLSGDEAQNQSRACSLCMLDWRSQCCLDVVSEVDWAKVPPCPDPTSVPHSFLDSSCSMCTIWLDKVGTVVASSSVAA